MLNGVSNTTIQTDQDQNSGRIVPCAIILLAVLYNAILAFVNINITPMTMEYVATSEAFIVFFGTVYLFLNLKFIPNLWPHFIFLFLIVSLSAVVMVANDEMFIKILRDMYIVVLFVLMGMLMDRKSIIKTFTILTIIVFTVVLIEVFKSDVYIAMFHPASYYENTRGIPPLLDSGFFRNTITYSSRFSFNFLAENRTSSVFLEQVSLANFSVILAVFMITFWKYLGRKEAVFFVVSMLFFLLTNDSRTGSVLVVALFVGYFVFSKLFRGAHFFIMPAMLIVLMVVFYDPAIDATNWTDDLKGRMGLTAYKISEIDFKTIFFGQLGQGIIQAADSGYIYLIFALNFFGFMAYWIYTSYVVCVNHSEMAKRYAWGVSLFISVNLLTSAAIFTIKVVAPLWIIGGYLYKQGILNNRNKSNKPLLS